MQILILLACTFSLLTFLIDTEASDLPTVSPHVLSAEKRQIVVGGDNNYPPYEWIDEKGNPIGFNVDFIRAIAGVMGWEVTFRLGPWDDVRRGLMAGDIDVIPMFASEERFDVVDFTEPFELVYYEIFTRRDSNLVLSLDEISGLEVILQRDALMHDYLKHDNRGARLVLVESEPEALHLLSSGNYDCAIVTRIGGIYAITRLKLKNLSASGVSLLPRGYALAVKKGDIKLRDQLNQGLSIIKKTGQYQEISGRWFGEQEPTRITLWLVLRYAAWIIIPLTLLAAAAFVWIKMLKKMVAEKTLEIIASESKYRRLHESMMDGFAYVDMEGNIKDFNESFRLLLGYSSEEIFLLTYNDITPQKWHESELQIVNGQVLERGYSDVYEKEYIRKDGDIIPVELRTFLVKGVSGENEGMWAIIRDITERRKAEEKIRRSNEELLQKNRELEQVVYVSSHDLRSPLVNIAGYSSQVAELYENIKRLLENLDIPDKVKKDILSLSGEMAESRDLIKSSVLKMDYLLKGLLQFSRSGRSPLKKEEVDMNKLISEIVKTFKFKLKETNAALEVSDLPGCFGDSGEISKVFSNLIDNAVKFLDPGRKGSIKISGYKDKGTSVYCVEDNGIGIRNEFQIHIFEIFNQVNPKIGGEGLGLSIAERIVERHDGKMWIESEEGKGSKFFVQLPGSA